MIEQETRTPCLLNTNIVHLSLFCVCVSIEKLLLAEKQCPGGQKKKKKGKCSISGVIVKDFACFTLEK